MVAIKDCEGMHDEQKGESRRGCGGWNVWTWWMREGGARLVAGADLLIFGGLRICMADFGWRASFGESTEEVGKTALQTGRPALLR